MVGGQDETSVVSFSSERGGSISAKASKEKTWAKWFNTSTSEETDREPQILLDLANNNLHMPLLNTNVDFCIGNGIALFRWEAVNGKSKLQPVQDPVTEKWLNENQINLKMFMLAPDFCYTGNFFLGAV